MPTKTINVILQQKWFDFTHPTEIEHYGYHFTISELRQFPEGRMILCEIARKKLYARRFARDLPRVSFLAEQFKETLDRLVLQTITEPKCQLRL